jgi:hypothetical protein
VNKTGIISLLAFCLWSTTCFSQFRFSTATGLSLLRNFTEHQQFFSVGHEIILDFHVNPKNGAYASFAYYSPEKKNNAMLAIAKSSTTIPQQVSFINHSRISFKQFSLGWKHYVRGVNDAEIEWGLYTITGFGIVFGKTVNEYSLIVDTTLYNLPGNPVSGEGHFKRLTVDLGLGWDLPVSSEMFFYAEAKAWIPTTEYPSKYLFINNNAPFTATIAAGIRILF